MADMQPGDVLDFWFEAGAKKWFAKDDGFDAEITARFGDAHEAAKAGAYDGWAESPQGALALIILLDQFPRNMHRGSALAFAADPIARGHASRAIKAGFDMEMPANVRSWFYLPLEHSENIDDQNRCIELCERSGLEDFAKWARIHADIIARFGRFPHRNAVLGRTSSAEEQAFIDDGGFAG